MPITKEQYFALVKKAKENKDATVWHVMEKLKDGRELCLVIGQYCDRLCQKLAVNIDDLQCDYDMDWYMPWSKEDYDVIDTQMVVTNSDESNWYNERAKMLKNWLNEGLCEVH